MLSHWVPWRYHLATHPCTMVLFPRIWLWAALSILTSTVAPHTPASTIETDALATLGFVKLGLYDAATGKGSFLQPRQCCFAQNMVRRVLTLSPDTSQNFLLLLMRLQNRTYLSKSEKVAYSSAVKCLLNTPTKSGSFCPWLQEQVR